MRQKTGTEGQEFSGCEGLEGEGLQREVWFQVVLAGTFRDHVTVFSGSYGGGGAVATGSCDSSALAGVNGGGRRQRLRRAAAVT